jgi:hypothetical protein
VLNGKGLSGGKGKKAKREKEMQLVDYSQAHKKNSEKRPSPGTFTIENHYNTESFMQVIDCSWLIILLYVQRLLLVNIPVL